MKQRRKKKGQLLSVNKVIINEQGADFISVVPKVCVHTLILQYYYANAPYKSTHFKGIMRTSLRCGTPLEF